MKHITRIALIGLLAFVPAACSSDDGGADPGASDTGASAKTDTSGGGATDPGASAADPGPGTPTDPGSATPDDEGAEARTDPGAQATPDPGEPAVDPGGAMPDSTETSFGKLITSSVPRDEDPEVSAEDQKTFAEGNTRFACKAYAWMKGQAEGNLFFSPHSISVALSMTYAGARGETASEMESALELGLGQEGTHEAFNYLDRELASRESYELQEGEEGDPFRLRVANSLWGHIAMTFLDAFLEILALNYGAGLRVLDFVADPEAARQIINAWVEDKTEERIKDLLPEGSITTATRLVLVNAIYFNASWLNAFDEADTEEGDFNTLAGSTVRARMMSQTEQFSLSQGDGYTALEMLYVGNEVAMLAILPDEGRFAEIESALDADKLTEISEGMSRASVNLSFPSFENTSDFALKKMFKSLGMSKAFTGGEADFSGMNGERDLFISAIIHKAFVKVDEAGTEAAAATAVVMEGGSAPPVPVDLTFDRPFIYLIVDKPTGAILFMGRMADPTG